MTCKAGKEECQQPFFSRRHVFRDECGNHGWGFDAWEWEGSALLAAELQGFKARNETWEHDGPQVCVESPVNLYCHALYNRR